MELTSQLNGDLGMMLRKQKRAQLSHQYMNWREADHSPPSIAEVKECVELYIHSPNTPSWRRGAELKRQHRDNFTFTLLLHTPFGGSNCYSKFANIYSYQLVTKFRQDGPQIEVKNCEIYECTHYVE